jgi:hypothetical protein
VQEHGAGAGKVLGDDRVQDRAGDPTLDDDLAEARGSRGRLVVVERVAVSADVREAPDVLRFDPPASLCPLTHPRRTPRPRFASGTHLVLPFRFGDCYRQSNATPRRVRDPAAHDGHEPGERRPSAIPVGS